MILIFIIKFIKFRIKFSENTCNLIKTCYNKDIKEKDTETNIDIQLLESYYYFRSWYRKKGVSPPEMLTEQK